MQILEDSKNHKYVEINNVRITYVPASDREDAKNWSGSDVLRIQAKRGGADNSLHRGAELPVDSAETFIALIAGLCAVYNAAK